MLNGYTLGAIPVVYIKFPAYIISSCIVLPNFFSFQLHEEDDALNMWMYDAVENNGKYTRCSFVC